MISENEARTDDGMLTKIEKLKRLMNRGVSVEDAAIDFSVKRHHGQGLARVRGQRDGRDEGRGALRAPVGVGRRRADARSPIRTRSARSSR